jgi:hypothetical protein
MSNDIRDAVRNQQRDLNRLNNNHYKYRDDLKQSHKKEIEDIKLQNRKEVFELKQTHSKKIIEAQKKRDEILEGLKKQLYSTQDRIQNEISRIRGLSVEQIEALKHQYASKHQDIQEENSNTLKQNANTFNNIYFKLQDDIESAQRMADQEKVLRFAEINSKNQKAIEKLASTQDAQIKSIEKDQEEQILSLKKQGTKEKATKIKKHATTMTNLDKLYNDELQRTTDFKISQINNEKQNFESAFKHEIDTQRKTLDDLNLRYEDVINSMKKDLAKEIKTLSEREHDSFYKVKVLTPKVEDHPTHYTVKIPAKEYEVPFYQLFGQKRELILTYTRGHEQKLSHTDGSQSHSSRSESHTQRFQVQDIVDQNKITKDFKDGVLSIKIEKA